MQKELIELCSNAVADARELKSAASFIFKADGALITKVRPPPYIYPKPFFTYHQFNFSLRSDGLCQEGKGSKCAQARNVWVRRNVFLAVEALCELVLSRYTLFVKQVSADIRAATPGLNAVSVMKECGAKWQALSVQQKDEWNSKSKQ